MTYDLPSFFLLSSFFFFPSTFFITHRTTKDLFAYAKDSYVIYTAEELQADDSLRSGGTEITEVTTAEDSVYMYDLVLSVALTLDAVVTIENTGAQSCEFSPSTVTFTAANWNQVQRVTVTLGGDKIDQGGAGAFFQQCTLLHSGETLDELYQMQDIYAEVNIKVSNDDFADTKLVPADTVEGEGASKTVTYQDFRVNFLGPITLAEGASETYGIRLDSEPTHDVTVVLNEVKPRLDTPAVLSYTKTSFVFTSTNWNVVQDVTVKLDQDTIDNINDIESFGLTYTSTSDDALYNTATAGADALLKTMTISVKVTVRTDIYINFAKKLRLRL